MEIILRHITMCVRRAWKQTFQSLTSVNYKTVTRFSEFRDSIRSFTSNSRYYYDRNYHNSTKSSTNSDCYNINQSSDECCNTHCHHFNCRSDARIGSHYCHISSCFWDHSGNYKFDTACSIAGSCGDINTCCQRVSICGRLAVFEWTTSVLYCDHCILAERTSECRI